MPLASVNEQEFEQQVLRSELPVLVDLYADWCQPCKQLEPILEQIASELGGKLKVLRVDVERSPMIARAFRVQSIPMLVLIHGGRPVDQIVGLVDKKAILNMVQPVLPASAEEVPPPDLAAPL
jgi:thioredoxin 1